MGTDLIENSDRPETTVLCADRRTAGNSTYKKLVVQWLNQALWFYLKKQRIFMLTTYLIMILTRSYLLRKACWILRIGNKEIEQLQQRRDELNEQLVNTYRGAPKTINKAYQIASKALQQNEEFTFSDIEIDKFLPENLRRTK
ncbi:hypothetical protein [Parapedobacter tibetensis]|uniref:hypothetical protein n=1 Tax=Parapedobacter tibetensis TaxID=2972951 RepID=UPI00214DC194|nr:hypothetical protein [Parapedobacter tibetensis]